jgi:hypothetical protein
MIWAILKSLIPGAWKWLAAAGAALVGLLAVYGKGRSDAKAKRAAETVKGVQAGAKGAAKAKADLRTGKTPEDIVRGNDHDWR